MRVTEIDVPKSALGHEPEDPEGWEEGDKRKPCPYCRGDEVCACDDDNMIECCPECGSARQFIAGENEDEKFLDCCHCGHHFSVEK